MRVNTPEEMKNEDNVQQRLQLCSDAEFFLIGSGGNQNKQARQHSRTITGSVGARLHRSRQGAAPREATDR